MGNKCDCVGEKTEASQFTIDKIKNNFYRGLQHQKININSEEETRLNNFIDDSTQYSVKDSETLTLKDQQQTQIIVSKRINISIGQFLLLAKLPKSKQMQKIGKKFQQAIIAYQSGFYIGNVIDCCPEGKGSFHFNAENMKNIYVKGTWRLGMIEQVQVFREGSKLLQIEMKSKDNARLTFSDPVLSNKSLYYEGTIKTQFGGNSSYFSQIMTGTGKLYFPNGDIYEGGVLNGKMHTQMYEESVYYSQESKTRFYGTFKEGKRCGKGKLEIQLKRFIDSDSQIYELDVEYVKGKMIRASELRSVASNQRWHQLTFLELGRPAKQQKM